MEILLLFLARRIEGFDKYNLDAIVEFSKFMQEEIMAYVKKYFMFNQMVSKEMHRKDMEENDDASESSGSKEIKPRMHDTIDE